MTDSSNKMNAKDLGDMSVLRRWAIRRITSAPEYTYDWAAFQSSMYSIGLIGLPFLALMFAFEVPTIHPYSIILGHILRSIAAGPVCDIMLRVPGLLRISKQLFSREIPFVPFNVKIPSHLRWLLDAVVSLSVINLFFWGPVTISPWFAPLSIWAWIWVRGYPPEISLRKSIGALTFILAALPYGLFSFVMGIWISNQLQGRIASLFNAHLGRMVQWERSLNAE